MQTPAARRITALVFGLLCTTAACHHDFVGVIDGNVSTPAALDFGAVPVGQTKALALPLTNVTSGPLALSGARVEAPFSVTAAPDTIPGGGDGAVLVSFSPQAARAFDQPLELTLDSPGAEPVVVRLTGQGLGASDPAASFVIAPASLSFTSTLPALPAPQQLRVRNTNGASLHWSLGLAAAGGLAITPSTGTLHPGEFADLTVQVVGPSGAGRFSRVVSVDTTEAGSQLVEITLALDESGGGPPPPPAQYGASVWPKFHQGNSCTGLSSVYTHTTGAVRWTARFGAAREAASAGAYVGSPTLAADGTVYQVGGDGAGGHLSAFEPVKGAVRWRAPISAPSAGRGLSIETTPTVVADGSIFVLSGSENRSVTHFFKVSAQGSVLWSDPGGYTDGFDSSPALGADGTLYLAYDDAPAVVYFGQGGAGAAPKEQGASPSGPRAKSPIWRRSPPPSAMTARATGPMTAPCASSPSSACSGPWTPPAAAPASCTAAPRRCSRPAGRWCSPGRIWTARAASPPPSAPSPPALRRAGSSGSACSAPPRPRSRPARMAPASIVDMPPMVIATRSPLPRWGRTARSISATQTGSMRSQARTAP